jgi:hypothetical protein
MNDEPSVKEMAALWNLVYRYIESHQISCEESVYKDAVYETSPDLVADMGNIVGFYEYDDEE